VAAKKSILERIATGDSGAVAECLDRYGALVWSLVRSRLDGAADAEDATRDIFVEIWRSVGRFDPRATSEAVFVAAIARRRLVDRSRALGRQAVTAPRELELPLFAAAEQRDQYASAADARSSRAHRAPAARNAVAAGPLRAPYRSSAAAPPRG